MVDEIDLLTLTHSNPRTMPSLAGRLVAMTGRPRRSSVERSRRLGQIDRPVRTDCAKFRDGANNAQESSA
jgi:hypothetical protein